MRIYFSVRHPKENDTECTLRIERIYTIYLNKHKKEMKLVCDNLVQVTVSSQKWTFQKPGLIFQAQFGQT